MIKYKREKTGLAMAVLLASAAAGAAHAVPFTPGDLVVTRDIGGNLDLSTPPTPGSTMPILTSVPLAGSGVCATVELDEYTPAGSLVQSIQLPNVQQTNTAAGSSYALTFSGTQNNEGTIEVSGNGKYFTIVGYNQTAGTDAANGTITGGSNAAASTLIQRVVGLISMDGTVNTTTGLTDVSSTQSIRSAYTTDGTNIWVGGSSGSNVTINGATVLTQGVHYTTIGSTTSTQISLGTTNQRILNAFDFGSGPQLLLSSNSGATQTSNATTGALSTGFRGIATIDVGLPTSEPTPVTLNPVQLAGIATGTPGTTQKSDNYWFKDANTLYIADQDVGATGGVQKWTFQDTNADGVADSWVYNYNITLGAGVLNPTTGTQTAAVGAHGLAGMVDPTTGNVDLFATTFDGAGANSTEIFEIVDNGTAFTDSLLATSAANSAFRGVAIVPQIQQLLLGDANGDNRVDLSDLSIVLNNFGETTSLRSDGNFDGAATIDLTDLSIVLNNFGKTSASSASPALAAAPEPGSLALLGLGVAGILARRRRA